MDASTAEPNSPSNARCAERRLSRILVAGLLGIAVAFVISVTESSATFRAITAVRTLTVGPGWHRVGVPDAVAAPPVRSRIERASIPNEATIVRLAELGMRNIVLCLPSGQATSSGPTNVSDALPRATITQLVCDGTTSRIEAMAASIAAGDAQAVVFDGTTADAHAFIEALRAHGSFAMVVLTPAVDAKRLVRMLSRGAATWLTVMETIPAVDVQRTAPGVRLGVLARNGAVVY